MRPRLGGWRGETCSCMVGHSNLLSPRSPRRATFSTVEVGFLGVGRWASPLAEPAGGPAGRHLLRGPHHRGHERTRGHRARAKQIVAGTRGARMLAVVVRDGSGADQQVARPSELAPTSS